VRNTAPEDTPVAIRWRDARAVRERTLTVGELKRQVLELTPGQRLCYVTDVAMTEENAARIVALAAGADLLYIEAAFLEADAAHAVRKSHLTARHAGELARRAGVRQAVPIPLLDALSWQGRAAGTGVRAGLEWRGDRDAGAGSRHGTQPACRGTR